MLSLSALLPAAALTRYDDHGDPAYTVVERVLRALRWLEWAPVDEIMLAAGIEPDEHSLARTALSRLVARGLVQRRRVTPRIFAYQLNEPAFSRAAPKPVAKPATGVRCHRNRCPRSAVAGRTQCQHHLDYNATYQKTRREARVPRATAQRRGES